MSLTPGDLSEGTSSLICGSQVHLSQDAPPDLALGLILLLKWGAVCCRTRILAAGDTVEARQMLSILLGSGWPHRKEWLLDQQDGMVGLLGTCTQA